MKIWFLIAIFGSFSLSFALYNECNKEKPFGNLEEKVNVTGCRRNYCRLKKNRSVIVQFQFTPEKDVSKVTNSIAGILGGIPLPYIGVDGADASDCVFENDGKTRATFPLKANTTYRYKRSVDILEIYPTLKVIVHWALVGPEGELMCFEMPARIID